MCGIAGRLGTGATRANVEKMALALKHRGPDDSGMWLDEGIALSHRRLAIIDVVGGKQPMVSASGRWVLIFNGEIYNFQDLKSGDLIDYPYKTRSDSEVILAALEFWGEGALNRLEGMFAIAAWDTVERRLLLARDAQGIKPLYLSTNGRDLIFGSEISALFAAGKRPEVDESNLDMFLDMRFVPSPHTLFREIQKLAPGHLIWVNKEGDTSGPRPFKFSAPLISRGGKPQELVERISYEFLQAVERQLIADVPIGVLLSGGIDSAAVTAAAKRSSNAISTFCIGYADHHSSNEFVEARRTAELLQTDHHELLIDAKSAVDIMPKLVKHLEEPVVTSSVFSYFLLCETVGKYRKVVLTGQGADEPWGGYGRHQVAALQSVLAPIVRMLEIGIPKQMQLNDRWKRLVEVFNSSDEIDRIIGLHSLFPGAERGRIRPLPNTSKTYSYIKCLLNSLPENGTFLEKLLALEVRTSLADNLLMLGDKLSMASGLEVRVPMLDPVYLKTVEMLPHDLRRGGFLAINGKALHKKVCGKLLPKEVITRPKKGFQTPIEDWLKRDLGSYIYDLVDSSNSFARGFLSISAVKDLIGKHRSGGYGNLERQLFAIWILEEWHNVFFLKK